MLVRHTHSRRDIMVCVLCRCSQFSMVVDFGALFVYYRHLDVRSARDPCSHQFQQSVKSFGFLFRFFVFFF